MTDKKTEVNHIPAAMEQQLITTQIASEKNEIQIAGEEYINIKLRQRAPQKKLLADHIAKKYVHNLDAVAIDAGSTLQLVVAEIMETKQFLSILTNNMTAFRHQVPQQKLSERANEFILTGGKYVALFDALLGNETINSFENFNPTVVIIGVSGLIPQKGFFCHGNDEKNIKELLFKKKDCTILIPVDYSKLGKSDSYLFGKTSEFRDQPGTKRVVVITPPFPPEFNANGTESYQDMLAAYERAKSGLLNDDRIIVDEVS